MSATRADGASSTAVDARLISGAALFGFGWALACMCPGPLLVATAASPLAGGGCAGLLLTLTGVVAGILASGPLGRVFGGGPQLATAARLKAALAAGAPVLDVRGTGSDEAVRGAYEVVSGALSAVWDAPHARGRLDASALPADKSAELIVHSRSGKRSDAAARFLAAQGYTSIINAGGPAVSELWACFGERVARHPISPDANILLQLFDGPEPEGGGSSTLSYVLGDRATGEAILIDPVLEQVDRDLAAISSAGLNLVLVLNTHCHADHITGSGELKRRLPGLRSVIAAASGAKADVLLAAGEAVHWAGGKRRLVALPTPGHTSGCLTYYDERLGAVFTGDALLFGGCGRTDFQGGSAEELYESVHGQIFPLPGSTLVYPAHDYKGRRVGTVAAERSTNPRLTKPKPAFVKLMGELNLPYPRKIDASLPANLRCGVQD